MAQLPPIQPLRIEPVYLEKVWGGRCLTGGEQPVGEAWLVHEENRISAGPWAGRTLGELSAELGEWLLGSAAVAQTGNRFPLLIKLLDTSQWLSVQVHPNDEQARRLEGAGQLGKTEAWQILETDPGAEIIFGLRPGISRDTFASDIRDNRVTETLRTVSPSPGETYFIPAGTVHALGPGLLLYEVQQTSDITYRVYDWDRPASHGRELHIEQAIAVTDPDAPATRIPAGGKDRIRVESPYFVLEQLDLQAAALTLDTSGRSFHALTCTSGVCTIALPGNCHSIRKHETVLIPAAANHYELQAKDAASILLARVP